MIDLEGTDACNIWHVVEAGPLTVKCAVTVLEGIRARAVEGFNAFGHGGLEIGGVLYGVREGDLVRLMGFAELASEHAEGPGFVLSANDQDAFAALLKAPPGQSAVGWYGSHTRSDLALNQNDRAIFQRFFPQPGEIGLVMKPSRWGPAEATFYFREAGGELCDPAPQCRFAIDPVKAPAPAPEEHATDETVASSALVRTPAASIESALSVPQAALDPPPRTFRPRSRWLWIGPVLAALALWAIASRFDWGHRELLKLGLRASSIAEGQVRIEWDRLSAGVVRASSGTLEVNDAGSQYTLPLDAEQLKMSSLTYVHQSDEFSVRLRLKLKGASPSDREVVESIRFVAPTRAVKAPAPAAPPLLAAEKKAAAPAKEPPTAPVPSGSAERALSRKSVESAEPSPQPRVPNRPFRVLATPPPLTRAPSGSAAREFALPNLPSQQAAFTAPVISLGPPPPVSVPAPVTLPSSPVAASPRATALPPPTPRSGRLIWTGSLARRGVLEIEGGSATVGALNGALPAIPVVVRISPAEFAKEGMIVYTSDAARNTHTEPATKANGWNTIHYVWDRERAGQVSVLEAPNAGNQFNRLVLRNDARNCSLILIEWAAR